MSTAINTAEEERFNHHLLIRFATDVPETFRVTMHHTGVMVTHELPMLDSILGSIAAKRLLLTMSRHGAAIPIRMGVATGVNGSKYRFFLASYALLSSPSSERVFTVFQIGGNHLELGFKRDVIEARPSDQKILWGLDVLMGNFPSVAEYAQQHRVKIYGKSFVLRDDRGPFKRGLSVLPVIHNPLVYVASGFEELASELYIPEAIGYKKSSMVVAYSVDRIDADPDNPAYPLAAVTGKGEYVLLRHLPRDLFRDGDIVSARIKYMRTIPPYYLTTNRVPCLVTGSIVKRMPRIEFHRIGR